MALSLYAHPFSSYCQKVLIALYENQVPFELKMMGPDATDIQAEFAALWPLKRMPALVDDGRTIVESSIIIEHLAIHHPGPVRLIPNDADTALPVRMMDRFFDNYVMTPMQKIVFDSLRPAEERDRRGCDEARALLDTAYAWADSTLKGRQWAAGDLFSLADCAGAPALFYANWLHPIPESCAELRAYRQRLATRPSFGRVLEEARPYRPWFPLDLPCPE
jgi:glutathione S-transferase